MKGIIGRFKLLYYYFISTERRKWTSLENLFKHSFAKRCEGIAPNYSSLSNKDEKFSYYKIKGFENQFIFPNNVPYHNFAQVISEGMQPNHWHFYEIQNTKVQPNDVIVDCGSAEGFFAYKNLKKAKKIYLIEPLPIFVESLNKNFLNETNIEILPIALGNENASATIVLNESSPIASKISTSNFPNGVPIEIKTIDSLFYEKGIEINYLKADLEGFEESMILGALKTIKTYKPKIAITVYHIGQDANRLISLIKTEVPEYKHLLKGIEPIEGKPVMLHMWI